MTEQQSGRWGLRQVVGALVMLGIALAGNVWAPRLFTGFNYLLGSIGVLLMLRLFGLVPALVAALLAAACCKLLFGHYYMLVWLVPEPLFVWWWLRRWPSSSMIAADVVYWVGLGIPLIVFVFLGVLQVTPLGTVAAALMYLVIGITNALLATLLLYQLRLEPLLWPGRKPVQITIAQLLFQVLMLAIVLPALLVLVVSGRSREQIVKQKIYDLLEIKARQLGYEARQKIFDGFFPSGFGEEERRALDQAAVTAVLSGVQAKQQVQLHLMANKGEVIASTNPDVARRPHYEPLSLGPVRRTEQELLYHRMPPNDPPVPLWQRAGKSSYIRVYPIPRTPIYIIAETPFAPYQAQILSGHRNSLVGLLLYLGAGALLAGSVSRRIAVPLVQLSKTTTDLPGRLMDDDLSWPVSPVVEVSQLVENAQEMAHTLSSQFREIAQINAELEERVAQRTQELSERNVSLQQEIAERMSAERQRDHLMDELTMQLRFVQTLLDAIPNPVFYKGRDGRYLGCNRAFSLVLQVPREQVVGRMTDELFPPEDGARYREKDQELLSRGGEQCYETEIRFGDGRLHTVIVNKATYCNLSGELSGLIGVFIDITERKQAELELDRLMRELEAKNKELESIIYVSSHDLRSPLVNVQGFSRKLAKSCAVLHEQLRDVAMPPERYQLVQQQLEQSMPRSLEFITTSVEKMDSLLSGLLRLSRLGRAAIAIENLDMQQMLVKITDSLAYQLETAGALLTLEPLLPCRGDAVQVSQVFTNLLDNAIKYRSPERPLRITVSCRSDAGTVVYCVHDNGIGIHPDYHEQIWEIFRRINPRDIPGEGLGLTASRRMLDRLDGALWLESQPGEGSRFYVRLPAAEK